MNDAFHLFFFFSVSTLKKKDCFPSHFLPTPIDAGIDSGDYSLHLIDRWGGRL